nr:hypothetical protein [uncultured Draconibacterium sp.]
MKAFFKLGDSYCAVDREKKQVIICVDAAGDSTNSETLAVKIWTGKDAVESVESMVKLETIDQATFAAKYSGIVAKLHSQTPYA